MGTGNDYDIPVITRVAITVKRGSAVCDQTPLIFKKAETVIVHLKQQ